MARDGHHFCIYVHLSSIIYYDRTGFESACRRFWDYELSRPRYDYQVCLCILSRHTRGLTYDTPVTLKSIFVLAYGMC
jgi:hypothetical protein